MAKGVLIWKGRKLDEYSKEELVEIFPEALQYLYRTLKRMNKSEFRAELKRLCGNGE